MQALNPYLGELTSSSRAKRLEWLLQRVLEMQALVNEAEFNLERFMQEVVNLLERLTASRGAVVELVEGPDLVYRCASESLAQHVGLRLARRGSLSGLCVEQGRALRCDDSEQDTRTDVAACRQVGVRSMICAPLLQQGKPIGVLKVLSSEARAFDTGDEHLLRLLAASLGVALGNQLAFEGRERAEAKLRESEARLRTSIARMRTLFTNASDAIAILGSDGRVLAWNTAAERLFGWPAAEALGRDLAELVILPLEREAYRARLEQTVRESRTSAVSQWSLEVSALQRGQTDPLSVEANFSAMAIDGRWQFVVFLHDITARKRAAARLEDLAMSDALTGLSNRRGFISYCDRVLARAKRARQSFALLYIDLVRFKDINDQHGHQAGDQALREFARRLNSCLRQEDVLARIGGDEFALLAEGIATDAQAQVLVAKLQQSLAEPMREPPVRLAASVGVALYDGQPNALVLLREADEAMYAVKRQSPSDCIPGGFL